jgi:hypothetical protein
MVLESLVFFVPKDAGTNSIRSVFVYRCGICKEKADFPILLPTTKKRKFTLVYKKTGKSAAKKRILAYRQNVLLISTVAV